MMSEPAIGALSAPNPLIHTSTSDGLYAKNFRTRFNLGQQAPRYNRTNDKIS